MKYGYIFLMIISMMFGGMCFGAIKMSQDYLGLSNKSGCCSNHGGVSYCGNTGHFVCMDGTQSPSCRCK